MLLRELFVKLGLDTNAASFARGQLAVEGIKLAVNGMVRAVRAAVTVLPNLATSAANHFDEIDEASQKAGVGVAMLQELAHAASFSGMGVAELGNGLKFLSIAMAEAGHGGKEQKATFKELGVSFRNSNGTLRSSSAVMDDVADRFMAMEDGAAKTALAQKLFGKAGGAMIPFLNAGSAAIGKQRNEAHKLGLVYDKDTIKKGVEAADAQTRLGAAWKGLKLTIGAALLPAMTKVATALSGWIAKNRELIGIKVKEFVEAVGRALEALGRALAFVSEHSTAFKIAAGVIIAALVAMKLAAIASSAALLFTPAGAVLVGLVAVAAAVALIADRWDDVKKAAEDASSWVEKNVIEPVAGKARSNDYLTAMAGASGGYQTDFSSLGDLGETRRRVLEANERRKAAVSPRLAPGSGGSSTNKTVTVGATSITINAAPGMDEQKLASAAAEEVDRRLRAAMATL